MTGINYFPTLSPLNHDEVMKIKEMNFDWYANSPCQHLRKCIKNSMENMDTDVRVQRVNARISF